jgi:hypothetical protein
MAAPLEMTVGNQSLQVFHSKSVSIAPVKGGVMTDPKGSEAMPMMDGVDVKAKNAIMVAMEDLSESDQKKLEDEMAKRRQRKLACFQKT